jgi:hypothetical protein
VEKDGYDLLFVVDIQVIQRAFAIPVQASDLEFCGWLRVCLRHATCLYSFWLNGMLMRPGCAANPMVPQMQPNSVGRDESAESGWLSAPFPQGTFDLEQTSVSNNR